jgi:hypothetical protein
VRRAARDVDGVAGAERVLDPVDHGEQPSRPDFEVLVLGGVQVRGRRRAARVPGGLELVRGLADHAQHLAVGQVQ